MPITTSLDEKTGLRTYKVSGEMAATPVEIRVFRDRDEAEIWAQGGGEE